MGLYFDATYLPAPTHEYVAWVDIMGTSVSMSRSLATSANFVFKLHIAGLQAGRQGVILYPVMDGFYASSADQRSILGFLGDVFQQVAEEFNGETEQDHRFIIKGAVAFGPVVHGQEIPRGASRTMDDNVPYRDAVLLGLPMVQANTTEKWAPPFGIYVHESARTFSPRDVKPLPYIWWKWKDSKTAPTWEKFRAELECYYQWCTSGGGGSGYDPTRIQAHRNLALQYFG